jgi:hypothetical protein
LTQEGFAIPDAAGSPISISPLVLKISIFEVFPADIGTPPIIEDHHLHPYAGDAASLRDEVGRVGTFQPLAYGSFPAVDRRWRDTGVRRGPAQRRQDLLRNIFGRARTDAPNHVKATTED